jgi:hypothetical protein
MPRVIRAADHLSVDELTQRITQVTHHWHRLAWQVILTAHEGTRLRPHHHMSHGISIALLRRNVSFWSPFLNAPDVAISSRPARSSGRMKPIWGHAVAESTISRLLNAISGARCVRVPCFCFPVSCF